MTPEDRIEQLERQMQQTQEAVGAMFVLLFNMATEEAWRKTVGSTSDAADWLMMQAGAQEDQENHIAAHLIAGVADRLRGRE